MRMTQSVTALAITLGAGLMAAAQPAPADLSRLAELADLAVAAWCGGELHPGDSGTYAVAVTAPGGGGRYVVLGSDGTVVELAAFTGQPEISCYDPAAARALDLAISDSSTVEGTITVPWETSVVCAFVENTRAACWQHSPTLREFVTVGEWTT